MASQKDKDYHMLRNPGKYSELAAVRNNPFGGDDKESAEAHKKYTKLLSKYGFKSMVSDKRRRNSTRNSNQKDKQMLHQMQRAKYKSNLQSMLSDDNQDIKSSHRFGSLILI